MNKGKIISGAIFLAVSILFALSAWTKTISDDSIVLAMQWFCAVIFAGVGIWQLTRKGSNNS